MKRPGQVIAAMGWIILIAGAKNSSVNETIWAPEAALARSRMSKIGRFIYKDYSKIRDPAVENFKKKKSQS